MVAQVTEVIDWEKVMQDQAAEQNRHLYEAYAKIVALQEENAKLKNELKKLGWGD
jgi:hypothetical protein